MKKLLLMIGLIGSVYGNEQNVDSWENLKKFCTEDLTNSDFVGGVYTLNPRVTYNWIVPPITNAIPEFFGKPSEESSIPENTKLIIPEETTFKVTKPEPDPDSKQDQDNESDTATVLFLKDGVAIENNGSFIINESYLLVTENSFVSFINNAVFENNGMLWTINSNSHLTFSGSGDIANNLAIYTYVSDFENILNYSGSSITFSGSGDLVGDGFIYTYCPNSTITFSGSGNIKSFGGTIALYYNSKLIFSGKGDMLCMMDIHVGFETFSQSSLIISKDTKLIFQAENGIIQENWVSDEENPPIGLGNIDIEGELILQPTSEALPGLRLLSGVIGSGTIDMSRIVKRNMSNESGEFGAECIDISPEAFSKEFKGTIKLPINTKCKTLDLTNATKAKIFYGEFIVAPYLSPNTENRIVFQKASVNEEIVQSFVSNNITIPSNETLSSLNLFDIISSEYNTESNTSKYYLVTNDLEDDVFDTGNSEYNIYFDLQGTKPIDFVGRGIINFYGDNRGYMPTHPSSIYPKVNFKGENSVFPGVTVFKDATFEDGLIIPAGATVISQKAQDLTNLYVKGHLVI